MKRLFLSKNFVFNKFNRQNGAYTDNRNGIGMNYIAYMLKGRARIVSKDVTVCAEEGEAFFIPKGLEYESFWYGSPEVEFYSYGYHSLNIEDSDGFALQRLEVSDVTVETLHRVYASGGATPQGLSAFYSVMAELLPKMERAKASAEEKIARRAAEYIRENPRADMPQVAKACLVSGSYLYLAFKAVMNMTPNEYRQRRLCECGIELLVSTHKTLEEIAEMLGFSSGSYFRRVLKKHTGKTPREIRGFGGL